MTVVCVAQGSPMPTVTLYVSGVMKRKERTRHMVVLLSNVTRKMDQISCHADNGYGPPAQASKRINIGRKSHSFIYYDHSSLLATYSDYLGR